MDWTFGGVPDWILTTAIALSVAAVAYWKRHTLGLGVLQMATNKERDAVIALQEERIALLEQKLLEVEQELVHMRTENRALRKDIAAARRTSDAS